MRVKQLTILLTLATMLVLAGCAAPEQERQQERPEERGESVPMAKKVAQFTPFELTADLSGLTR